MNLDNIKKLLKVRLHTSMTVKITFIIIAVIYIIINVTTLVSAVNDSSVGIISIDSGFYIMCIVAIILALCLIASDNNIVHYDVFPQTAFTRYVTDRLLYYTLFAALIIFILLEHCLLYGILYIICKLNSNVFIGYDFSITYELLQAFGFFMSFAIILEIISILITLAKKNIFISFSIVVLLSAIIYLAILGNELCIKFIKIFSLYFAGEYAIIHIIKLILILGVLSVISYYLYKHIEVKNTERIRYMVYVLTPFLSISFIIMLISFADYTNDVFEKSRENKEPSKVSVNQSIDISDIDINNANLVFEGFDNMSGFPNTNYQIYTFGVTLSDSDELNSCTNETDTSTSDIDTNYPTCFVLSGYNYSLNEVNIMNKVFKTLLNKSEQNEITLSYTPGYEINNDITLSDYYNDKISLRKDGDNIYISRTGCDRPTVVALDSWPEFFKDKSFDNLTLGKYIFSGYNSTSGNRGQISIYID